MNSQLIPVFNGTIANETTLLVNARDLHEFLEVRRDFSTWIKNRITEYGFAVDVDYILVHQNGGIKGRGGDRRSKEYHLTLDTAKELAMVERNEKGRQIRRYFIECEKKLRQSLLPAPMNINYPLSWFSDNHPYATMNYVDRKVISLDASVLFDMPSPTMRILNELHNKGYNVDAAIAEFNAFKHLTEEMRRKLLDISRTSEKSSRFGFNVNL
ncbi:TPA: antA/AntB antirepressor family protein [Escherichia coli]|uniref:antA/AntB antirepressor family protein n=1 Tax=Escherichia coli TaxID=562 RepID=UPI000FC2E940|nr:antA/AntB antirepressor family protein [Escherichia coli]EEC7709205.1 phage antirepressor Ant [Escherichia coli]EIE5160757.1 antA/AntB antirepressor family protein [Escherichia coli]EIN2943532.1 antA/AntB antirepressor family protein [Escherichia coli]MCX8346559.1 antA/AntB antirepressor family protein [Escherichia coli]HCB9959528.1 antA/AntB antirepressor family protein [Escherichia coli]